MRNPLTHRLTGLLALCGIGCGADIKGEPLPDSGTEETDTSDTGAPEDTADSGDTQDTSPPATGNVTVDYTVSWEIGEDTLELCTGQLTLEDVDTSHRTWTLWTDAGLDLDPAALPSEAPAITPVGDGNSVNPGSYRFKVDAAVDADLPAYDAAVSGGAPAFCLLASGAGEDLETASVVTSPPPRDGNIDAVELRIAVQWTDL